MFHQECIHCGQKYGSNEIIYTCTSCGHLLEVRYDLNAIKASCGSWKERPLSVWRYKELLPVKGNPVTLQEGGTPLYHLQRIGAELGMSHLYAKHEGMNPSGSFKDRGMTVGVSLALELGMKSVACASTGNASASLAMYCAKAGIQTIVLLPAGKVALGKRAQALMHGAKVIFIQGNFDRCLELVRVLCETQGIYLLNSINPCWLEGQKTIGFEIIDQLGYVPDRIVMPVGNGGNISAIYKGFGELTALGMIDTMPKMTGVQSTGAQPVVQAIEKNLPEVIPEQNPETSATAIRIGAPFNAEKILTAIRKSSGTAISVTDAEILDMQRDLAQKEGIGVEPASAASVAGLKKLVGNGIVHPDERVVCVVTGHLLKDPETIINHCAVPISCEATLSSLLHALGPSLDL